MENENFDQLKKLLELKRHEMPPPGYFNKLPGEVVSRIRAERASQSADAMTKLKAEAPWLVKLWQVLESKPIFAVSFGTAICALMLAGIFFAEKPPTQSPLAGTRNGPMTPVVAGAPTAAGSEQPLLLASTNQNPPNLFEQISNQTAPVGFQPR